MVQTVHREEDERLLDYYASILIERKERLLKLSKYVAADAYFSRQPFVDQLVDNGLELISRFRKDVSLRYLYQGPTIKGRGRPKTYDGPLIRSACGPMYSRPALGMSTVSGSPTRPSSTPEH